MSDDALTCVAQAQGARAAAIGAQHITCLPAMEKEIKRLNAANQRLIALVTRQGKDAEALKKEIDLARIAVSDVRGITENEMSRDRLQEARTKLGWVSQMLALRAAESLERVAEVKG